MLIAPLANTVALGLRAARSAPRANIRRLWALLLAHLALLDLTRRQRVRQFAPSALRVLSAPCLARRVPRRAFPALLGIGVVRARQYARLAPLVPGVTLAEPVLSTARFAAITPGAQWWVHLRIRAKHVQQTLMRTAVISLVMTNTATALTRLLDFRNLL